MTSRKTLKCALICAMMTLLIGSIEIALSQTLTLQEELGKLLFFDENLSQPAGQSCASCHAPATGFAEPDTDLPVSEGVVSGRFGTRNSPSAAYAVFFPGFNARKAIGGQFWDGRAADLTEQAKGPFLNPLEMNNDDEGMVIGKIAGSSYAWLFEQVYGPDAFANTTVSYDNMAAAIAAYEGSREVNQFASKFDSGDLTREERAGRKLFTTKGKCAHCHPVTADKGEPVLFTDFKYHNLGLPTNTDVDPKTGNRFFPEGFQDPGLGTTTGNAKHRGKFKTPHLRNVDLTGPYMHNGVLKTLKEVVHFYNTRDIPGEWDPPEVPERMDSKFMGHLGLTDAEEDLIVVYMLTFTDLSPSPAPPLTKLGIRYTAASFVNPQGQLLPSRTMLHQCFPNPFNPETWIPYQLAEDMDVSVVIHSASGRLVRTLDLGHKPAGFYTAKGEAAYWDGANEAGEQVSSGIYFYIIQAGEFTATRKMVVAK